MEVPPHEWPWCFDLKQGEPRVLEQKFEHRRDTEGNSVRRTTLGGPHNPHNWPRIPFTGNAACTVEKLYDTAQAEDVSLRKAFIKLYDRKKLNDEQIELLADAPDIYVAGYMPQQVAERDQKRADKAKAFLAEVDAASPKPSGKPSRETVKA